MTHKRTIITYCAVTLLLGAVIFWTFSKLPQTFFQQDEWWGFGQYIQREQAGGVWKILTESLIAAGKVHVNPLTELGMYLQQKVFGMNFAGYAYTSMAFHFINSLLVYLLVTCLLKNKVIGYFVALLFAVSSISHQAVTWVSGSIQTEGSLLFTLFFALLFYHYLVIKKRNQLYLYLSLFCIIIALLFKETVLPFVVFTFFLLVFSQSKKHVFSKAIFVPMLFISAVYAIFRTITFLLAPTVLYGVRDALTQPDFPVYLFRLVALPFRVITQSIFPQLFLLNLSKGFMFLAYPQFILSDGSANPYVAESVVFDYLGLIIGNALLFISLIMWKILKENGEKELARGILFSLVVMIGGALAIIFIPARPGFVSIIEPRHMYAGMFGASMFLVLLFYTFFRYVLKLSFWKVALTVFLFVLITFHIKVVQSDLQKLFQISTVRKSFLAKVKNNYPTLPKEVVFYTQSDRPYYGMAEDVKILPLQSGFGRMLMVWYQDKENFSGCLYEKAFLHGIKEEGYRSCSGRGVGYYRQYQTLLASLRQYNLSPDIVIAYNWNSKKGEFSDITLEIRTKLLTDLPYESTK